VRLCLGPLAIGFTRSLCVWPASEGPPLLEKITGLAQHTPPLLITPFSRRVHDTQKLAQAILAANDARLKSIQITRHQTEQLTSSIVPGAAAVLHRVMPCAVLCCTALYCVAPRTALYCIVLHFICCWQPLEGPVSMHHRLPCVNHKPYFHCHHTHAGLDGGLMGSCERAASAADLICAASDKATHGCMNTFGNCLPSSLSPPPPAPPPSPLNLLPCRS
jgi:hypothetical protein